MNNRQQKLASLEQQVWDIVVVGGGITGAGVAREASRRGLRVLLLEQQDFAWGTSSRSSKMVHGGLRYLAMGDSKLTKHSLHERERLLKEVPGLVERMGYYFLLKKSWFPWRLVMKILLAIYDNIAGIRDHRHSSNAELKQLFKDLDVDDVKGAAYYTDAVTDDTRLVLRVLQEAEADGCVLLNYCKVESCLPLPEGGNRLQVQDQQGPQTWQINAKVVVNSTGAWADQLRGQRVDEQRVRPLKGSHLVLADGVLPLKDAISCSHPQDGRSVFIFPWLGRSVIGTTDLDYKHSLDHEAGVSNQEVDYLLQIVNCYFPASNISRQHIVASFSGVRPVIASDKNYQKSSDSNANSKKPSKERRDHAVWDDQGLITASGGKLTTFRLMAEDVLEKAQHYLPGFEFKRDQGAVFRSASISKDEIARCGDKRLLGCYGFRLDDFLKSSRTEDLAPIASTCFSWAEIHWALQHEWVEHLDDLLLRRTRLGLLLAKGGEVLLPELQPLCQQYLHWDELRWQQELSRYQDIYQQYYSLPEQI